MCHTRYKVEEWRSHSLCRQTRQQRRWVLLLRLLWRRCLLIGLLCTCLLFCCGAASRLLASADILILM